MPCSPRPTGPPGPGRRDHALLLAGIQTGLRAAEIIRLRRADVELGAGPHLRVHGKGRKERVVPLTTQSVRELRTWLKERGGTADEPVFPSRRGTALSHDALGQLVAKHAAQAQQSCPSLHAKHVTPHVLRHTCAMTLLESGVDVTVIALWLGHEQVETTYRVYLHADLSLKQRALARTAPAGTTTGRYRAPDVLLAFLESL